MKKWRVAAVSFEHMHVHDLLRLVHNHPTAEIVALCDPNPALMQPACREFGLNQSRLFTDVNDCMRAARPDLVIVCAAPVNHAAYVEAIARYDVAVLLDKPFAIDVAAVDRIMALMPDERLAINWPLAWYPPHLTTKRLITENVIGTVREVHYYGGNRGPLYHRDGTGRDSSTAEKSASWWYQQSAGGGSLLDYLGYGATLGTWFMDAALPIEVSTVARGGIGLEVDEQSVTLARYENGISVFATSWETLTDPWQIQTQPRNGFIVVGSDGTIQSSDYATTITMQIRDNPEPQSIPVDAIQSPNRNPIEYMLHCIETGTPISGPLAPNLSRNGQQIIDTAIQSHRQKRSLPFPGS